MDELVDVLDSSGMYTGCVDESEKKVCGIKLYVFL